MKVFIYPNPNKRTKAVFERVVERDPQGGREVTKVADDLTKAPGVRDTFSIPQSIKRGGHLETGLLDFVDNPYDSETFYKNESWERVLKGKDKILRQHVLEYKHGQEYGFYTNKINLSPLQRQDKDKIPFFQTSEAYWDLNDGATVLDIDNNWKDELLYYAAKACSMFANSYVEMTGLHDYYIAKEEETDQVKVNKAKQLDAAIAKLIRLDELQDDTTVKFVKALNMRYKNVSRTQAYKVLREYIQKNVDNIKSFNATYNLWDNAATRREFEARALLKDYLDARIILQSGAQYSWTPPRDTDGTQPDTITWARYKDVVNFLVDKKFQRDHEELSKQFKFKTRFV